MNLWKASTFVLASALAVAVGTSSIQSASAGDKKPDPKDQPQPMMESAGNHLEKAYEKLEKATPDKGGHRVKAMKLIKEALAEVEAGIKWDNENKSKDEKDKGNGDKSAKDKGEKKK